MLPSGGGAAATSSQPDDAALFAHNLHRREFGSHLTNVIRGLVLEAHGYKVTVTELVGWEHSAKNELIIAKRVNRFDKPARDTLRTLLERFHVEPSLVKELRRRDLDPTGALPRRVSAQLLLLARPRLARSTRSTSTMARAPHRHARTA